jgi:MFS family permease
VANRSSRPTWVLLVILGASVIAFGFQQTAVIPAIPSIQRELHATRGWSAWLLSGYLVASSVLTPLGGKLADRFGKRPLLLISQGAFLAGSVGCALTPNFAVLVAFRALQGLGGSVFPLALALVPDLLPHRRVAPAVSLLTGGFGLGTALGFGLAGPLVAGTGTWRWVFGAGALVVAVALALAALALPGPAPTVRPGLDLPGAVLLGGGLALPLAALTAQEQWGWGSPWVVGGFAAGAALLAGWVARELRTAEPLLDLRLFARRPVLLTNLSTVALGYALFGAYFLLPYLVPHAAVSAAGLVLLPVALGQLVTGSLSDRLAHRISIRWVFGAGLAMVAAASLGLAFIRHGWEPHLWALLLGLGAGLGIASASTLVTTTAGYAEGGVATSMNSVLRRVGGGVGAQVCAALLAGVRGVGAGASTPAFLASAGVAVVGAALAMGLPRAS